MVTNILNSNEALYEKIGSAIEKNDTQLINSMIATENLSHSKNGLSFLERAAEFGNNHILELLWNKIPTTAKQQAMILKEAVSSSQIDTVRFLLEEKNVDASTKIAGTTISFWAEQIGSPKIAQLLLNNETVHEKIVDDEGHDDFGSSSEYSTEVFQEYNLPEQTLTFNANHQYDYLLYIYTAASLGIIGTTYYISLHKNHAYDNDMPNPFTGVFAVTTAAANTAYSYVSSFFGVITKIAETDYHQDNDDFAYELPNGDSWRDEIVYREEEPANYEHHKTLNKVIQDTTDYIFGDNFNLDLLFNSNPDGTDISDLDETDMMSSGIPYQSFLDLGKHLAETSGVDLTGYSGSGDESREIDDLKMPHEVFQGIVEATLEAAKLHTGDDDIIDIDVASDVSGDWDGDIFYNSDTEI